MSNDYKTALISFYKAVKAMETREENHGPTETINDREGQSI